MNLADRLRAVVRPDGQAPPTPSIDHGASAEASLDTDARDAATVLGGQWQQAGAYRYLVIDRAYAPSHRHGRVHVHEGAGLESADADVLRLLSGAAAPDPDEKTASTGPRALFLDLETTGLAGGAGTYAFLVGCGWYEDEIFRVRQWLLSSFVAERALLTDVGSLAATAGYLVTYNGRTFDVPLLETRCLLQRIPALFTERRHLDLLHPARRFWREDEAGGGQSGCRLTALEARVCGYTRRGDVPGSDIPQRYFDFVRTGRPALLGDVLEHNRLDLLSLALLTARAVTLVRGGASAARSAREALGLGRVFERAGRTEEARACFCRAAGYGDAPVTGSLETRAQALRAHAVSLRRSGLHGEAADVWRQLLDVPHVAARDAAEALAIHHEHRLHDPTGAHWLARRLLAMHDSARARSATEHRLHRLERRLGRLALPGAPLFDGDEDGPAGPSPV